MTERVAQALALLLEERGRSALWRDPEKTRHSMLLRCPEAALEIEAVVAALEEGFPQRVEASSVGPGFLQAEERNLGVKRGIPRELARAALDDWSRALQAVPPA